MLAGPAEAEVVNYSRGFAKRAGPSAVASGRCVGRTDTLHLVVKIGNRHEVYR